MAKSEEVVKKKKKMTKEIDVSGDTVRVKRRVEVTPEEPPAPEVKKKKKKKRKLERVTDLSSNALTVAKVVKRPTLSKRENTGLSISGDLTEELQHLIINDDLEKTLNSVNKGMLRTLIDVLPYLEEQVRVSKGSKGAHGLNMIISSIREVATDMAMAQDRGQIGQQLVQQLIQPTFLDMSMEAMQAFELISQDARGMMTPEEFNKLSSKIREHKITFGENLQKQYTKLRDGIVKQVG